MRRAFAAIMVPLSLFAGTISENLSFSQPEVSFENGVAHFKGEFYPSQPGAKLLPLVRRRILLPHGVAENSIEITLENSVAVPLPGKYELGEVGVDFDSEGSYRENEEYTLGHIYSSRIGRYRQYSFLELMISPIVQDSAGVLTALRSVSVNIGFETDDSRTAVVSSARSTDKIVNMVDNSSSLDSYGAVARAADPHLAIVTTSGAVENLRELNTFISSKKSRGFRTSVITEDVWGGGSGDAAADNLHNWLRENYLQEEIDYLLIIGDPTPASGNIAMKIAHAYYSGKKAATDFYYSDLTGNWDADGDGKYGETDDVKKSGGIDAIPDVIVGRIPLYGSDYASVDHILKKTVEYEQAKESDVAWRNNILLSMDGYYGGEGYEVGETIYKDLSGSSWDFYRMYSRNVGGCDEFSITEQGVTSAWTSRGQGIVSWLTHGKEDAALHIMNNSYARQLDDATPSFVLMGSCLNGKPDFQNNLAYTILKNGAVGVVSGSETTIFKQPMGTIQGSSYNHGFIHGFTVKLAKNKPFIGDALADTKEEADMGCWKNYCAFNLYGDPTIGLGVYNVPTAVSEKSFSSSEKVNVFVNSAGLNIAAEKEGNLSVEIFSLQGKMLLSKKGVLRKGALINVPLYGLAKGAYVVKTELNGKVFSQRFVKL